jgi:hypothetical protein
MSAMNEAGYSCRDPFDPFDLIDPFDLLDLLDPIDLF